MRILQCTLTAASSRPGATPPGTHAGRRRIRYLDRIIDSAAVDHAGCGAGRLLTGTHRRQQQYGCLQYSRQRRTICAAAGGAAGACDSSKNLLQAVSGVVSAHYLPLALLGALLLGALFPSAGVAAAELKVPAITTFGIFVVQGLQLRRKEATAALASTDAVVYGLCSILLLTPLIGVLVVQLPLQPPSLALGLGVFAAMPTALSSGITFTQQVGGNVSLALLLTVVSNILGIFTMPFTLPHIVAASPLSAAAVAATSGGVQAGVLEPVPLLFQLCQTILLPTVIGAAIRGLVPGAAAAIDQRRKLLSYISAGLLALVPWMQISKTASQRVCVNAPGILAAAAAGVAMHVVFLVTNYTAARLLRLGGVGSDGVAIRRAVLLVSSVKTLPVAVTVCSKLGPVLGEAVVGVAVVPCVLAHLGQILFDSIMVSKWTAADQQQPQHGKAV